MKMGQKLGIGAFLCLSVAIVIVACIRFSGIHVRRSSILTWEYFWLEIEACVPVCMVSLPAFRSVFASDAANFNRGKARPWYSSAVARLRRRKKNPRITSREAAGDSSCNANERLRDDNPVGTSRLRKEWNTKNPTGNSIGAEKIRIEEEKAQHEDFALLRRRYHHDRTECLPRTDLPELLREEDYGSQCSSYSIEDDLDLADDEQDFHPTSTIPHDSPTMSL